jgi:hypothetical protein
VVSGGGGGAGGGRGFNAAIIDTNQLQYISSAFTNFDTWADTFIATGGGAHFQFVDYLRSIPSGALVMLATGDEAGLNAWPPNQCSRLIAAGVMEVINELEANGSREITNYCYNGAWGMIFIKGSTTPIAEGYSNYNFVDHVISSLSLYTVLTNTAPKPRLSLTAYPNNFGSVSYIVTVSNLVSKRDVDLQYSDDLQTWNHLVTINNPMTNYASFADYSSSLAPRYFRAVPDHTTLLLPH